MEILLVGGREGVNDDTTSELPCNSCFMRMNVHREQKPETHSVSVRIWPDNGFLSLLKRLRGALVSEEF